VHCYKWLKYLCLSASVHRKSACNTDKTYMFLLKLHSIYLLTKVVYLLLFTQVNIKKWRYIIVFACLHLQKHDFVVNVWLHNWFCLLTSWCKRLKQLLINSLTTIDMFSCLGCRGVPLWTVVPGVAVMFAFVLVLLRCYPLGAKQHIFSWNSQCYYLYYT